MEGGEVGGTDILASVQAGRRIDFYLCFMERKMIEPTEGDNRHDEPETMKAMPSKT